MNFEALWIASKAGELLLLEDGFCHWHLRRDGQVTIHEIISQRPGTGSEMLEFLKGIPDAECLVAKCPQDYESNKWYAKKGFKCIGVEETRTTGRKINVWRMDLPHAT